MISMDLESKEEKMQEKNIDRETADQTLLSRRQFLHTAGLAGAGILAAACAPEIVTKEIEVTREVEVMVGTQVVKFWMLPNFNANIDLHLIQSGQEAGREAGFDVLVEPVSGGGGWHEWTARLLASHEAGTSADIFTPQLGSMAFMEQSLLLPIPDVFDKAGAEGGGWTDVVMNNFTLDGVGYLMDIGHAPAFLHIREDLVNDAGFQLPFADLDELKEAAIAINDPDNNVYGTGMAMAEADDLMHLQPLLWAFGGAAWDEDSNPTLTRPENAQALKWFTDLYKEGLTPEASAAWGGGGNNQAYLSGQAAIVMNPGSVMAAVRRGDTSVPDLLAKSAAGPWPQWNAEFGPQCQTEAGQAYGIWVNSQVPDQAKQVLAFMWTPEQYIQLQRMGESYLWPALMGAYEDEFFTADKINQQVIDTCIPIMQDESWPSPPRAWTSLWSTWSGPACLRVVIDGWSPEEALEEAQKTVEAVKAEFTG